jgi:hypothetical protein
LEKKFIKYTIELEIDEPICKGCGKRIKVGKDSYEYDPPKGTQVTKKMLAEVYCKKCLPKDSKVKKGTQLYNRLNDDIVNDDLIKSLIVKDIEEIMKEQDYNWCRLLFLGFNYKTIEDKPLYAPRSNTISPFFN